MQSKITSQGTFASKQTRTESLAEKKEKPDEKPKPANDKGQSAKINNQRDKKTTGGQQRTNFPPRFLDLRRQKGAFAGEDRHNLKAFTYHLLNPPPFVCVPASQPEFSFSFILPFDSIRYSGAIFLPAHLTLEATPFVLFFWAVRFFTIR